MLRHPRMRIPEMGLEYVDRVAQRLGAGRDVVPELAFREQLPAGTAIGGEVHPANEAGGGPNRCASRMFVEEGTQESRTSIRTSRHTDVRNAPGGGGRRLFTQGQRLRCVRNGPAPVGHLLHSDQRPTHESERQVKEAVEVCRIHAPFNAAAPDFDQGKLQAYWDGSLCRGRRVGQFIMARALLVHRPAAQLSVPGGPAGWWIRGTL